MSEQCEHSTTETLASFGPAKLAIEACTWGCNELLVSVRGDNGISHEFTIAELAALRERVRELEADCRDVLIGGNHLANHLLALDVIPSDYESKGQVPNLALDVWIAWRAIMDLSETFATAEGGEYASRHEPLP